MFVPARDRMRPPYQNKPCSVTTKESKDIFFNLGSKMLAISPNGNMVTCEETRNKLSQREYRTLMGIHHNHMLMAVRRGWPGEGGSRAI